VTRDTEDEEEDRGTRKKTERQKIDEKITDYNV